MTTTPRLGLTYIDAAQAQKHITHNSALDDLDVLVQASVLSATLTAAPGSPTDGDAYIVSAGATGIWAAHDNAIAVYQGGVWAYHTPQPGWRAWNVATGTVVIWGGTAWGDIGYSPKNILGTVSQSAGTPTGAVIERGSNANGEYIRFADGTQICTRECAIDVTSTVKQSFSFAASFSNGSGGTSKAADVSSSWSHQNSSANAALQYNNIKSLGNNGTILFIKLFSAGISTDPASTNERMTALAIGRWF